MPSTRDFLIAADTRRHRTQRTGVAVDELAAVARAAGQVVLSGATLGGFAYDDGERGNGVFTAAVLDGLRGQARADENGFITVHGLGDYVQGRVVEWVRRHRPEHAEQSLGIGQRLEGPAADLPLAVDPEHSRAAERYRMRREEALLRLRDNLGRVLTGALYDEVVELLPTGGTGAEAEELLEEIEALDGGVRSQRSLRDYLRERRKAAASDARPDRVRRERIGREKVRPGDRPGPETETAGEAPTPGPVPRRPGGRTARTRGPRWRRVVGWSGAAALVGLSVGAAMWISGFREAPSTFEAAPEEVELATSGETGASTGDPAWPSRPEAGRATDGPFGMRFRYVPAGTYWVGRPEDEAGRYDHETRHRVRLTRGFWLSETEVTQAQWRELIPDNPSYFPACGADCPVETVSWYDAVTYANRLSDHAGLERCYELSGCSGTPGTEDYTCDEVSFAGLECPGFRLPTEAEWEVAARAGRETALYTGDLTIRGARDGPELDPIAWYGGNSGVTYEGGWDCSDWSEKQYPPDTCGTHPVGRKDANRWGVHDMLGNVHEWVWDWYGVYPPGLAIDPTGPDAGTRRVLRGGSWGSYARHVRAAYRYRVRPGSRDRFLGFRLARGQGPPEEGRSPG